MAAGAVKDKPVAVEEMRGNLVADTDRAAVTSPSDTSGDEIGLGSGAQVAGRTGIADAAV